VANTSSWRMRVEEGIPIDRNINFESAPATIEDVSKTSSAGKGAKKHGAGLLDEEACAGEEDEDDD